jgi:hypothetical protein
VSYDLRPTAAELSEARALVEVALDDCERAGGLGAPLRVALGWTDDEAVRERRAGVSATTFAGGQVELAFNSDVEGWTDALGPVVALQYGRAWADEYVETAFRWQRLLREAFADRFATAVSPEGPTPWRVDDEAVAERWTAMRGALDERDDLPADRATMGVAAAVGRELFGASDDADASAGPDVPDAATLADLDRGSVADAGDDALQ